LDQFDQLERILRSSTEAGKKTILFGVSFALIDFTQDRELNLPNLTIIETGGMKGRREEITRMELHAYLNKKFGTKKIFSEYGMTELQSQAYMISEHFVPGKTMSLICREINDPFNIVPLGKSGLLNVIDLANVDTCSFIATEDIGRVYEDGSFEVLGRLDYSALRGCNLLYDELIS
jgi:hypothetical protein